VGNGKGVLFMTSKQNPENELSERKLTLTYGEIFDWNYEYYIKIMLRFAGDLGRERVIEMIKKAVEADRPPNKTPDPNFNFKEWMDKGNEATVNMAEWETIEETDFVYEMKVTKCLWYDSFRKHDACDIGYATICHSDFFSCKARHPGITLYRTKSLMEGHDCCNHRWVFEKQP
jgi:hypothetical protein